MTDLIKKHIDTFFSTRYVQLEGVSRAFCSSPDDDATELLHVTYEEIIKTKNTTGIENAIEKQNLFNFFYVAIRYQHNNKNNPYQQLKIKNRTDLPTLTFTSESYSPSEDEKSWLQVNIILEDLKKTGAITQYKYNLFRLLYTPEFIYDISNKTTEEVHQLRKLSLRKLAKNTHISHMAIHAVVTEVKNLIKKQLN